MFLFFSKEVRDRSDHGKKEREGARLCNSVHRRQRGDDAHHLTYRWPMQHFQAFPFELYASFFPFLVLFLPENLCTAVAC